MRGSMSQANTTNPQVSASTSSRSPVASGDVPNVDDYIEVWWADDLAYYRGKVVAFNPTDGLHKIHYDDGETESLDMRKEPWRLIRAGDSVSHPHHHKTADNRDQVSVVVTPKHRSSSAPEGTAGRKKIRRSRNKSSEKVHSSSHPSEDIDAADFTKKQNNSQTSDYVSSEPSSVVAARVSSGGGAAAASQNIRSSAALKVAASVNSPLCVAETSSQSPPRALNDPSKQSFPTSTIPTSLPPVPSNADHDDALKKDLAETQKATSPESRHRQKLNQGSFALDSQSDTRDMNMTASPRKGGCESFHAASLALKDGEWGSASSGQSVPVDGSTTNHAVLSSSNSHPPPENVTGPSSAVNRKESFSDAQAHDHVARKDAVQSGIIGNMTDRKSGRYPPRQSSAAAPAVISGPARKRYTSAVLYSTGERQNETVTATFTSAQTKPIGQQQESAIKSQETSVLPVLKPISSFESHSNHGQHAANSTGRNVSVTKKPSTLALDVDRDETDTEEEMEDFETPLSTAGRMGLSNEKGGNFAAVKRPMAAVEVDVTSKVEGRVASGKFKPNDPQLSSLKRRRIGSTDDAVRRRSESDLSDSSTAKLRESALQADRTASNVDRVGSDSALRHNDCGWDRLSKLVEGSESVRDRECSEAVVPRDQGGRDVLPLDHVMTAVVQATVMILDERLRPIANRIEELGDELQQYREESEAFHKGAREYSRPGLSTEESERMFLRQLSSHGESLDRLRNDLKQLETSQKDNLTETFAVREAELKRYFDEKMELSAKEISLHCRNAVMNAISSSGATPDGAAAGRSKAWNSPGTTIANIEPMEQYPVESGVYHRPSARSRDKRQRVRQGMDQYSTEHFVGIQTTQPPSPQHPQTALSRSRQGVNGPLNVMPGHTALPEVARQNESQHHASSFVAPDPAHSRALGPSNYGVVLQREPSRDANSFPAGGQYDRNAIRYQPFDQSRYTNVDMNAPAVESATTVPVIDDIQLSKNKALHLLARQVTVWLLETQHECRNLVNRAAWARDTTTKCFQEVYGKLQRFESYTSAFATLSANLGDDNVELDWFVKGPHRSYVGCARRNYAAWDPPPSDEEWALEELLLAEISNRFHAAKLAFVVPNGVCELTIASELAMFASSGDTAGFQTAAQQKPPKDRATNYPLNISATAAFETEDSGRRSPFQAISQRTRTAGTVPVSADGGIGASSALATNALPAISVIQQPDHARGNAPQ